MTIELTKIITNTVKTDIVINEITLMTVPEFLKYEHLIKLVPYVWYLKTQNEKDNLRIHCIDAKGQLSDTGILVNSECCAIRPIMKFAGNNINVGDILRVGDKFFDVIDFGYAVCNGILCTAEFNNIKAETTPNMYLGSNAMHIIDNWMKKYNITTGGKV